MTGPRQAVTGGYREITGCRKVSAGRRALTGRRSHSLTRVLPDDGSVCVRCFERSAGGPASEDADLAEEADLVVEQVFFHDLAVLPVCDRAKVQLERLSRRVVNFAVETLPRTDHLALPFRDRAGPVAGPEHHAVWIVFE